MPVQQPPALQEYRGFFSGTVIRSPHVCTAMDGRSCHMIGQIHVCNELLYSVMLELQEYPPGQLAIGASDYLLPKPVSEYQIDEAFRLLCYLLRNHSCISSLHIMFWNYLPKYQEMIISSYRATTALRSLRLGRNEWLIRALAPTLSLLSALEELQCYWVERTSDYIEPLCCLLKTTSVLKKLALPEWTMTAADASLFCSALSMNSTLADLSINGSCIMPEGANLSAEFAESFGQSTTLRNLYISDCVRDRNVEVKCIIDAVGRSKSLRNLSLSVFNIDNEASAAIAQFLSSNCVLKAFSLEGCWWNLGEPYPSPGTSESVEVPSPRIRPWIAMIQKNRSLEELRLNLSAFSPSECQTFFAELQYNTSLKRLVIGNLYWYVHRGILTCNRSSSKTGVLSLMDGPDILITECKQLSDVSMWLYEEEDTGWVKMALRVLSSCSHVTNLDVCINHRCRDDAVEELLADYIKNTNALRELKLTAPDCWLNFTEALKLNSSLRKLTLGIRFTKEEVVRFATMLQSSDNIYALNIATTKESLELLLHHLYPGLSRNYTLISLFYYWGGLPLTRRFYLVRDIIRRNNDIVRRAAYCATGNNSRMCVEALELVAKNPALVEKICEVKYVGEEDAAEIVQKALRTVLGFDYYMCVSGVVKHRVRCLSGNAYRLHFSDLDDYSWRLVRRFLRVSDVLSPIS